MNAYKNQLTNCIKGMIALIIYYLLLKLKALPLILLGIDIENLSNTFQAIYLVAYQIILIGIIVFIFKDTFFKDAKKFFSNFHKYRKEYFKYWYAIFGGMIICNLTILIITNGSMATNESLIRSSFAEMPLYMYISAVLIAPLLEELVFRKSFRSIFNNDYLFIIMSGLTFGAVHVVGYYSSPIDLLYLIPYSLPGFVFAYTLVKSKNIFVPIGLHFFHNFALMSLQVLLLFL